MSGVEGIEHRSFIHSCYVILPTPQEKIAVIALLIIGVLCLALTPYFQSLKLDVVRDVLYAFGTVSLVGASAWFITRAIKKCKSSQTAQQVSSTQMNVGTLPGTRTDHHKDAQYSLVKRTKPIVNALHEKLIECIGSRKVTLCNSVDKIDTTDMFFLQNMAPKVQGLKPGIYVGYFKDFKPFLLLRFVQYKSITDGGVNNFLLFTETNRKWQSFSNLLLDSIWHISFDLKNAKDVESLKAIMRDLKGTLRSQEVVFNIDLTLKMV